MVKIIGFAIIVFILFPDKLDASSRDTEKCETCQDIVNNFKQGLKNTSKSNFGGGNTDWEEKSLGSYATSETRLLVILENICKGSRHENYCHTFLEELEETIENWWFNTYKVNPEDDFYKFLCIDKQPVCCPVNQYGPECKSCKGLVNNEPCSGHGKCSGNSTRSGDGSCSCDDGYLGEICDSCSDNHFYIKTKTGFTCQPCHIGCQNGCTGEGATKCNECAPGWTQDSENGCVDNDECTQSDPKVSCSENEFCQNVPGSYKCTACDPACSGCTSAGPNKCNSCKQGYELVDDTCQDINECSPDSASCNGMHEVCVNKPGSYECNCANSYQRSSNGNCEPIPKPTQTGKKKKKTESAKTSKSKKDKRIWTKRFGKEFFKYASALLVLGIACPLIKGRIIPTLILVAAVSYFIYHESIALDNIFARK